MLAAMSQPSDYAATSKGRRIAALDLNSDKMRMVPLSVWRGHDSGYARRKADFEDELARRLARTRVKDPEPVQCQPCDVLKSRMGKMIQSNTWQENKKQKIDAGEKGQTQDMDTEEIEQTQAMDTEEAEQKQDS